MASAVLSMLGTKFSSFKDRMEKLPDATNAETEEENGSTSSDSNDSVECSNPTTTTSDDNEEKQGETPVSFIRRIQEASHTCKVESHKAALRAKLTLFDREMKSIKHEFGLEAYEIMERNRNIGEQSGGEADPEVVEIFLQCGREMKALYEIRKRKMTDLTKSKREKALCINTSDKSDGTKVMVHQRRHLKPTLQEDVTKPWSQFDEKEETPPPPPEESAGVSPSPALIQRKLSETWNQAKESYKNMTYISELKSDLSYIDKEIEQRKHQFGVELFDQMFSLGDDWSPRDVAMQELYRTTKERILVPFQKREMTNREINDLDEKGYVIVTEDEVKDFVLSHPTMYVMLHVNTGIPEEECQQVAIRVAKDLILQKHFHSHHPEDESIVSSSATQQVEPEVQNEHEHDDDPELMTRRQFMSFVKHYVENPKGAQEFFHRTVFSAFDSDANGVLDKEEVEVFLNTFYKSGSIFQGDIRLPEKDSLMEMIDKEMHGDPSRTFTFDEIRNVMCGSTDCDRRISIVRPSWTISLMTNLKATKEALGHLYEGDKDNEEKGDGGTVEEEKVAVEEVAEEEVAEETQGKGGENDEDEN